MKKEKMVVLFDSRKESIYSLPNRAGEFWKWLTSLLEELPEQFRDSAIIEFGAKNDYGDLTPTLTVSYRRPETDEEERQREEHQRQSDEQRREILLRQLRELDQKRGNAP